MLHVCVVCSPAVWWTASVHCQVWRMWSRSWPGTKTPPSQRGHSGAGNEIGGWKYLKESNKRREKGIIASTVKATESACCNLLRSIPGIIISLPTVEYVNERQKKIWYLTCPPRFQVEPDEKAYYRPALHWACSDTSHKQSSPSSQWSCWSNSGWKANTPSTGGRCLGGGTPSTKKKKKTLLLRLCCFSTKSFQFLNPKLRTDQFLPLFSQKRGLPEFLADPQSLQLQAYWAGVGGDSALCNAQLFLQQCAVGTLAVLSWIAAVWLLLASKHCCTELILQRGKEHSVTTNFSGKARFYRGGHQTWHLRCAHTKTLIDRADTRL